MQQPKSTPKGSQSGATGMTNPDELAKQQHFEGKGLYPVSDEDYDLVAALAHELQGLERFQKYTQDAGGGKFWQDALKLKQELAELFTHELAEHAREGHFGTGQHREGRL